MKTTNKQNKRKTKKQKKTESSSLPHPFLSVFVHGTPINIYNIVGGEDRVNTSLITAIFLLKLEDKNEVLSVPLLYMKIFHILFILILLGQSPFTFPQTFLYLFILFYAKVGNRGAD